MNPHTVRHWVVTFFSLLALAGAGLVAAESVSSVGRLSYISGRVNFLPAGESAWIQVGVNQPLTTGDRLELNGNGNGRGELQLSGTVVRLAGNSDLSIGRFDDGAIQLQLSQGTLIVKFRRMAGSQIVEVITPNLSITLRQPGEYRLDVDAQMVTTTTLHLRSGQAELRSNGSAYIVTARPPLRFAGTDLRDYQQLSSVPSDGFDRWAAEREQQLDKAVSSRYVSPDVIGYEELDNYGRWDADPEYGNFWYPTHVSLSWSPYQNGSWSWVVGWGWTWVDDAPWGFAVTHYGRWVSLRGRWCWVPGPARQRAVYTPVHEGFRDRAPAMVGRPGINLHPNGDYRNDRHRNVPELYPPKNANQTNAQSHNPVGSARETINSPEFNTRSRSAITGRTGRDVNDNPAYPSAASEKMRPESRLSGQVMPAPASSQPQAAQPVPRAIHEGNANQSNTHYRGAFINTTPIMSSPVIQSPPISQREQNVAPQTAQDISLRRQQIEQKREQRNESRNDGQSERQFQRSQLQSIPSSQIQQQQVRPSSPIQNQQDRDGRGGYRRLANDQNH